MNRTELTKLRIKRSLADLADGKVRPLMEVIEEAKWELINTSHGTPTTATTKAASLSAEFNALHRKTNTSWEISK
jgi:hypothetical protein